MAGSGEAIRLYRSFLREGYKFSNYNVRECVIRRCIEAERWYVKRKAREEFRKHREDAGEELKKSMEKGGEMLDLVKRQVILYKMYAPAQTSIMDLQIR